MIGRSNIPLEEHFMNRLGMAVVAVCVLTAGAALFQAIRPTETTVYFLEVGKLNPKTDELAAQHDFKPTDTAFYARARYDHAHEGWRLRSRWVAVKVAGSPPNTEIYTAVDPISVKENTVEVSFKRPQGFPVGDYRLEMYVDSPSTLSAVPSKTADFDVKE
jgi:hypothetical protein